MLLLVSATVFFYTCQIGVVSLFSEKAILEEVPKLPPIVEQ